MARRTLDRLLTFLGLTLAALLLIGGALLTWGHYFVANEVHTQLSAQQIYFPAKGSTATAGAYFAPMRHYAGQQLTTGKQAQVYGDHFIAVHLKEIGGGKTYAQLSAAAQAAPTDTKLAGTVETVFKGQTLRGLLLNAYAFDTMATIAGLAAIGAYLGALIMLILSALGWRHSRRLEHDDRPGAGQLQPSDQPAAVGKPVAAVGTRG